MSPSPEKNILLLMSGSIACAKASSLISEWRRKGWSVKVACTGSASQFIGRATLEGLGAEQVFDDTFEAGRAMDHINLARWADAVIACPATSSLINSFSTGIARDAVTTLWQAAYGTGRLMAVVPAMNTRMWEYPATRESVAKLESWGIHVLPTAKGELACGEFGHGRMIEPSEIVERIDRLLEPVKSGSKILVTAGGTREPIDTVRYIGNMSTGRTAAVLVEELTRAGHDVTWLGAVDAVRPGCDCQIAHYGSFRDLDGQLRILLGQAPFSAVIHAAAVSDFSVASIETESGDATRKCGEKLASDCGLTIRLEPNPKLLTRLRGYSSNPDICVVGFKLTHTPEREARLDAVSRLFECGADAVVHNDLGDIAPGHHSYVLHVAPGQSVDCTDSQALAQQLQRLLEKDS